MRKIKSSVVFKSYSQQQGVLLPPSLEELIGEGHLVKIVNEVVEQMVKLRSFTPAQTLTHRGHFKSAHRGQLH